MSTATTSMASRAAAFKAECARYGFAICRATAGVVTIAKRIKPNDPGEFAAADMDAPLLLMSLGARGGSQWGTDGGSVGGMIAMRSGEFRLNQSGVPIRLCRAIEEATAQ